MSRRTAHDVLKRAFEAAGLNGHLATHSLRKSFVQRLYDRTGDTFAVQEMLGHKNVATTQKYLGVDYASVREALKEMAVSGELHVTFWAVQSKNSVTKPCSLNSHAAGTTSPVCAKTKPQLKSSKSEEPEKKSFHNCPQNPFQTTPVCSDPPTIPAVCEDIMDYFQALQSLFDDVKNAVAAQTHEKMQRV